MNVESIKLHSSTLKTNIFSLLNTQNIFTNDIDGRINIIIDNIFMLLQILIDNTSKNFKEEYISSILKKPINELTTTILKKPIEKLTTILVNEIIKKICTYIDKFIQHMTNTDTDNLLILYIYLFKYFYYYIVLLLKSILLQNNFELYNKVSTSDYRLLNMSIILTKDFKNLLNYETKYVPPYKYKYMKYKIKYKLQKNVSYELEVSK